MALESPVVKKRCAYINEEQKNLLVEFMGKHPELQSGKFSATFTFKHAQKLWEKVTAELHEIPDALKEWKQWRKTWQDMRSSTKAKNTSIKNHAKGTGGGPASSQALSEVDENILALVGLTAVEGHKTIQESKVEFEWGDDSEICDVDDVDDLLDNEEAAKSSPVQYNNQELMQNYISSKSLSSCKIKEHHIPNEISKNDYNNNKKLPSKITSASGTMITEGNSASHIPVVPIASSTSNNKGVKRTSAARRYDKSIEQTEKLAKISYEDSETRKLYYEEKLKLYKTDLALKERDVIAKENISLLLEQLVQKAIDDW